LSPLGINLAAGRDNAAGRLCLATEDTAIQFGNRNHQYEHKEILKGGAPRIASTGERAEIPQKAEQLDN